MSVIINPYAFGGGVVGVGADSINAYVLTGRDTDNVAASSINAYALTGRDTDNVAASSITAYVIVEI